MVPYGFIRPGNLGLTLFGQSVLLLNRLELGEPMTLKALVLDVDGTLSETSDVKRAAFNQAFAEFDLDWVWTRASFAQITANALPGYEVEFYTLLRHPELHEELDAKGMLRAIPERQKEIYLDLLDSGAAPLRPGVARLIAEIVSSPVKLAICSTGAREEYESLLFNRFGPDILGRLACSVVAGDGPGSSPVRAYRQVIGKLMLNPPDIMVIEDSDKGVAAAASLGMSVIATPSFYTRNNQFTGAFLTLSDLGHPAAPFQVLKGDATGIGHVSLSALRAWHQNLPQNAANAANAA